MSTAGVGNLGDPLPEALIFMVLMGSKKTSKELAGELQVDAERVHHIFSPDQAGVIDPGVTDPESSGA